MEPHYCECCNAQLPDVLKLVTVYRRRRGKHFIFEHVPARVCQKCGERYFPAISVSEMERGMTEINETPNLVSVPIIELQPAA